ncbi:hypothetical protein B0H17DRAFT_1342454 [Mycena rosella]|uniref:Uncharacterized protein n=1 Tax=Mycena rosella TaxID=1033263 RepID=A0AAD7AWH2_MYCRO|nr:hypothetical protein B0H17DRAFT_1342454 [Mycena rosella]
MGAVIAQTAVEMCPHKQAQNGMRFDAVQDPRILNSREYALDATVAHPCGGPPREAGELHARRNRSATSHPIRLGKTVVRAPALLVSAKRHWPADGELVRGGVPRRPVRDPGRGSIQRATLQGPRFHERPAGRAQRHPRRDAVLAVLERLHARPTPRTAQ